MPSTADPPDDVTTLPDDVVDEVERLTRLARDAVDADEAVAYRARRDETLAAHGYDCRVRDDDRGATLVCYPLDWFGENGTVRFDYIDDTARAVERSLADTSDPEDWDAVDAHNRAVARRVREKHGSVHGDTADAFADFMSNHYARRVAEATPGALREFREDYFPRNAWPTDAQRESLTQSLELVFRVGGADSAPTRR